MTGKPPAAPDISIAFCGRFVSSSHVRFGVARIRSNHSRRTAGSARLSKGSHKLGKTVIVLPAAFASRSHASGLRQ